MNRWSGGRQWVRIGGMWDWRAEDIWRLSRICQEWYREREKVKEKVMVMTVMRRRAYRGKRVLKACLKGTRVIILCTKDRDLWDIGDHMDKSGRGFGSLDMTDGGQINIVATLKFFADRNDSNEGSRTPARRLWLTDTRTPYIFGFCTEPGPGGVCTYGYRHGDPVHIGFCSQNPAHEAPVQYLRLDTRTPYIFARRTPAQEAPI